MGIRTQSILTAPLRTVARFFTRFQVDDGEIAELEADDPGMSEPSHAASATATSSGLAHGAQTGVVAPRAERASLLEREAGEALLPREPLPAPGPQKPQFATGERRSPRVLVPVPIRVTASDASGVVFTEDTVTVNISAHGARISLIHSLLPDDIVLIKNLENGIEQEFRVIGGFEQVIGRRREWGLEAVSPKSEIWGAQLTRAAEGFQPQALIECAACQTKTYSPVSSIEYEVLLSIGMISRHCDRCGETTRWKPGLPSPADGETAAGISPTSSKIENRKARRLRLTLRLRVRNAAGVSEIVHTRDVSKGGICFASIQRYQVGEAIFITFLSSNNHAPYETKGTIAWSAGDPGNRCYGVRFVR